MSRTLEAYKASNLAAKKPNNKRAFYEGWNACMKEYKIYIGAWEKAPPEVKTEEERMAYAFGWWQAMEAAK